ncbi:MAG: ferric reductase-like transmembrane domain-containing protein [Candidatus Aenigmarchaeota archaeon]|nr:ferric reductase-like transmembrane domain-containing protein [Candidatus Aenigmarchaeota archaeon]
MAEDIQPQPVTQPERPKVQLFAGARANKGYVLKASLLALAFWLLQFLYQFFAFSAGDVTLSLIRSFAFSGASLIGLALVVGPLARLTKYNFIVHRRSIGVWGFTFIIMHFFAVMALAFNFNQALLFWDFNPFINFLLFGFGAYWLFMPLYLTSTDWATQKLGYKNWKRLHRLAYPGYILAMLHYTQVNPQALQSAPGYLLLLVTGLAIVLQVAGFVKTISRSKNRKDLLIGLAIIALGLLLAWASYSGMFKG